MRVAFSFNGPNKLEKISFNNIVAMRISAVFGVIVPTVLKNSATTNLDTVEESLTA